MQSDNVTLDHRNLDNFSPLSNPALNHVEVQMVSFVDMFTKDVKPFKTVPLRRPGFSAGICYCTAVPLSILINTLLSSFGFPNTRIHFILPVVLTYIFYREWVSYAKRISSKKNSD